MRATCFLNKNSFESSRCFIASVSRKETAFSWTDAGGERVKWIFTGYSPFDCNNFVINHIVIHDIETYLNDLNRKESPSLEARPLTSKWTRFCLTEPVERDPGWSASLSTSCLLQSCPGISLECFQVFQSASSLIKLLWLRLKGDHTQQPD